MAVSWPIKLDGSETADTPAAWDVTSRVRTAHIPGARRQTAGQLPGVATAAPAALRASLAVPLRILMRLPVGAPVLC